MRDCLIVLGMHRSGTSALAGAVHRLGAAVGSDIVEAQDDNVRGYYEHRGVLELHESLLAACGSAWDDIAPRASQAECVEPAVKDFQRALKDLLSAEFTDAPLWEVKDPRLCRLLPIWLPVLADLDVEPHFLFAHRSAAEVADSLARRNGFSADKSELLWVNHVVSGERASRGFRRFFVEFDRLLQDPVRELERAASQLEIEWPRSPASREESLACFLDPGLRHSSSGTRGRTNEVTAALEAALAAAAENPLDEAAFDDAAGRRNELQSPDPLLVEHLHQFVRRETTAKVWAAKEPLRRELSAVSNRLGEGLVTLEDSVSKLRGAYSELSEALESRVRLAEDRRTGLDKTLDHLTEVAAGLETTTGHQDDQIADLRSRLDRLQHEVEVETRLEALRGDLDHLGSRVEDIVLRAQAQDNRAQAHDNRAQVQDDRVQELANRVHGLADRVHELATKKGWWQRLGDRLMFWRSPAARPKGSANS